MKIEDVIQSLIDIEGCDDQSRLHEIPDLICDRDFGGISDIISPATGVNVIMYIEPIFNCGIPLISQMVYPHDLPDGKIKEALVANGFTSQVDIFTIGRFFNFLGRENNLNHCFRNRLRSLMNGMHEEATRMDNQMTSALAGGIEGEDHDD